MHDRAGGQGNPAGQSELGEKPPSARHRPPAPATAPRLRPDLTQHGPADDDRRRRLGTVLITVAALLSAALSIALWFTDNRDEGLFVGLLVPPILAGGAF